MNFIEILERKTFSIYAIIGLLAFVLYANSLANEFAFDDAAVLTENKFVQQGLSGIPTILRTGSWDGIDESANIHIYRPVQLVVLALQYEIFGLNPFGYHLVHVLSYVALCLLVYHLLASIFINVTGGGLLAFLSTILFTAHPVHTEVVANIKGNGDLIAMLLGIVTLIILWRSVQRNKPWYLLLVGAFFLLALLTKETIVSLVGIAFLMLYFFSSASLKKIALVLIPMLVSTGIYLITRSFVFGEGAQELVSTMPIDNVILMADGLSQEVGLRLYALGKNLQLLAYPYPLVYMYVYDSIPMVGFWDVRALLPLAIYTTLGICFIINFRKNNIWGFAIGFYFVALALFSNIIVSIPNIVSERWLLLPSLGFCIALGNFLIHLSKTQKGISLFLLSVILFGYSGYTIQRNTAWKNNLTLSETDIRHAPESVIINGILANMLLGEADKKGGYDTELLRRSAYHYEKATRMNPSDAKRANFQGIVHERLGEHAKAAVAYGKAKGFLTPIRGKAAFSEAKNWYLAGEYQKALQCWANVDAEWPNNPDVTFYIASTLEALDRIEESRNYYQRVLDLVDHPDITATDPSIVPQSRAKLEGGQ